MKRLFKHVTNSVGWQLYGPNEVANGLDFESVGFVANIVAWPVWVVVLVLLHVVGAATVILSLAVLTIVIPILGPLKLRMLAKRALESRRRAEEMRAEVVPLRARAWLAESALNSAEELLHSASLWLSDPPRSEANAQRVRDSIKRYLEARKQQREASASSDREDREDGEYRYEIRPSFVPPDLKDQRPDDK